jgi:hypothetical protein
MAIPGDMVQRGLGDGRAMMDSRWVAVLSGAIAVNGRPRKGYVAWRWLRVQRRSRLLKRVYEMLTKGLLILDECSFFRCSL